MDCDYDFCSVQPITDAKNSVDQEARYCMMYSNGWEQNGAIMSQNREEFWHSSLSHVAFNGQYRITFSCFHPNCERFEMCTIKALYIWSF